MDRSARTIALTSAGEQLLGYARRMLSLNDEIYSRLTHQEFEGELNLGVPDDIVYPSIPQVLQRFSAEYPRVKVQLISSFTRNLKEMFAKGECDVIVTTEDSCDAGGETLVALPLQWVGAPGGQIWKTRPLRLAYEHGCIFRQSVQEALDRAGIAWEMAVESDSTRAIEASVSADLAVHTQLQGMEPPYLEPIPHSGALPDLASKNINLYVNEAGANQMAAELAALVRKAYRNLARPALSRAS